MNILARIRRIKRKYPPWQIRFITLVVASSYALFLLFLLLLGLLMSVVAAAGNLWILAVGGGLLVMASISLITRALRATVTTPVPARVLSKTEGEAIKNLTRGICRRLRSRIPVRIELDDDENASVYILKCGLFAYKPVLRIGLPLLMSLSVEEFKTVLAHECSHLRRYDDFTGRVLHRLEMGWLAANDGHSGKESSLFVMRWFARWFWPRLCAWLSASARLAEERADAVSARHFPGAGAAKVRVGVISSYGSKLAEPWLSELMESQSEPPEEFTRLRLDHIRSKWVPAEAQQHLSWLLAYPDYEFAPHPTLARVLEITGESASEVSLEPPPPLEESAAVALLGPHFKPIEAEREAEKRASGRKAWSDGHSIRKRARLEISAANGNGGPEAAELLANAWLNLGRQDLALPYLRQVRIARPKDANVALALALAVCSTDQPDAHVCTHQVLDAFPQLTPNISGALAAYHARMGDTRAAQSSMEESFRFFDRADAVHEERNRLSQNDVLVVHQLDPDLVAQLKVGLLHHQDVAEALLTAKQLTDFHNAPIHVVLVRYMGAARGSQELRNRRNHELARDFSGVVGECFFTDNLGYQKLWRQAGRIEGARLFSKE